MSLNVEKIGRPLASIEGTGYLKGKQIWVATGSDKPKEGFPRLELPDEFHFQQIPNTKSEREILYLTGASGSGKSTLANATQNLLFQKGFQVVVLE